MTSRWPHSTEAGRSALDGIIKRGFNPMPPSDKAEALVDDESTGIEGSAERMWTSTFSDLPEAL